MRSRISLAVAALAVAPVVTAAQQMEGPPPHYLTISAFRVPFGEERGKVIQYVEKYMGPASAANPKVLSFRLAMHNYGPNSNDMMLIQEFANWADIQADCDACDKVFQAAMGAEGSAERKTFDDLSKSFLAAYSAHVDNILLVPQNIGK
jgi:hypothetical protein